ncbi:MAG: bis(5'-nucleosyl)-tetraphosphatase (symmetrical) YqeK [Firmicutes bacterium]|nr:bis(5'-nucleosyl)-tetraphosphatase (symmetrical) YqeK [Bacillota bacterium]
MSQLDHHGGSGGRGPASDPGLPDERTLEDEARRRLTPARFEHVRGVVEAADELARRFGADPMRARVAAWLHDLAKDEPPELLLRRLREFAIVLDEVTARERALWHAPVGAEIARRELGVQDEDVLAAVRYHTTGRSGMSRLEEIVFLADIVERGRQFPGVEELRRVSRQDLDAALLLALDGTIRRVLDQGGLLHPDSVAARNDILLRRS